MAELENNNTGAEQNSEPNTPKTLTEDEINELLERPEIKKRFESYGDRRATEATKTTERRLQNKEREAAKLARMNEDERLRYDLEQRMKELDEREAKIKVEENRAVASSILSSKDYQIDLAGVDLVVAEDAETMNERIKILKKCVQAARAQMLAGKSPQKAPEANEAITKERFAEMSLAEQNKLYHDDPELYQKLTQR